MFITVKKVQTYNGQISFQCELYTTTTWFHFYENTKKFKSNGFVAVAFWLSDIGLPSDSFAEYLINAKEGDVIEVKFTFEQERMLRQRFWDFKLNEIIRKHTKELDRFVEEETKKVINLLH